MVRQKKELKAEILKGKSDDNHKLNWKEHPYVFNAWSSFQNEPEPKIQSIYKHDEDSKAGKSNNIFTDLDCSSSLQESKNKNDRKKWKSKPGISEKKYITNQKW